MRYLEQRRVREVPASALPDDRTSPDQIPVVNIVLAFFAALLTGSRHFARSSGCAVMKWCGRS
jgi:hypothetical protein